MSAPDPAVRPPSSWIQRNLWNLVAAGFLLVIALTPAEVSWFIAIGDAILLWVLFSIPLFKSMTRSTGTGGRVFFGGMAILLGAFGAVLLVGLACMGPLSRLNIH